MMHDQYDDGLVHSHGWACSERGRMVHRPPAPATRQEIDHDDGLVHGHGWACSERGQMARAPG
ncbi:hypothetical protein [Falsiroseomonas sp.]|uniref:hypothetical protein n=1 Tax=Falsiroseomonas sp. TaxID=2870721 RepID=UPI0027287C56|nr:hypothetical protein [Falsiroseomonas sp.]MDO9500994.1 hypothetical protein [Falsiroseomonas sp.]MDP3418586.1 hypothetical protein [Falsiroseomonas sp.]